MIIATAAKTFALGLLIGAAVGASTMRWVSNAQQAKRELTTIKTDVRSAAKVQTRMNDAATYYERERAQIEIQSEAPAHDLEKYLDARPAVRDLDLGPEWLCITDRAAGRADARCAAQPVAAVPGANPAGLQPSARHSARLPPRAAPAPNLQSPARGAGSSGSTAPSGRRSTPAAPTKSRN